MISRPSPQYQRKRRQKRTENKEILARKPHEPRFRFPVPVWFLVAYPTPLAIGVGQRQRGFATVHQQNLGDAPRIRALEKDRWEPALRFKGSLGPLRPVMPKKSGECFAGSLAQDGQQSEQTLPTPTETRQSAVPKRGRSQKHANECKRAQMQVHKRAPMSAKGRKKERKRALRIKLANHQV